MRTVHFAGRMGPRGKGARKPRRGLLNPKGEPTLSSLGGNTHQSNIRALTGGLDFCGWKLFARELLQGSFRSRCSNYLVGINYGVVKKKKRKGLAGAEGPQRYNSGGSEKWSRQRRLKGGTLGKTRGGGRSASRQEEGQNLSPPKRQVRWRLGKRIQDKGLSG